MNYYEILEVSQNASQEVIKAAYKSLMQRYHPDRNPDNPEIAKHASLVVQAYETLSDPGQRAAYDIQLKQQLASHSNIIRSNIWNAPAPANSGNGPAAKDSTSYKFIWLLITSIILSSWLFLSLTKKQQSSESGNNQLSQQQAQANSKRADAPPEVLKKETRETESEAAARTIPAFITSFTVNLNSDKPSEDSDNSLSEPDNSPRNTDKPSGDSGKPLKDSAHVLSIPTLGVRVGAFDSVKFMQYLERNKESISQNLAEKLAHAKHEKLIKYDGESYLKELILNAICDTTGTDRLKDYPSANSGIPEHYGVVEILLPDSFSVK